MAFLRGSCKSASLCMPIPGVRLISAGRVLSVTDRVGRWRLDLNAAGLRVRFERKGYVPKEYPVHRLTEGQCVRLLEDRMIGYADRLSYYPGEEATFYIHSPRQYRAELVRYGLRTEVARVFPKCATCVQSVPDGRFVDTGLNWRVGLKILLEENMRPGLWGLRLRDEHGSYTITFVLCTPAQRRGIASKLVVLSSDSTWLSYNIWGGRSRYRNFEDEPLRPYGSTRTLRGTLKRWVSGLLPVPLKRVLRRVIVRQQATRATVIQAKDDADHWYFRKLSVHRSFPHCSIDGEDPYSPFTSHLADGEWRVLAWLEREDIPYDMATCWELDKNPDLLLGYKALVLNTHCEYWSRSMYAALKRFHTAGGWVMNLSGNSIFREIEFFEDGSHRCVSLRFGKSVEDESALLGVRFDERGYGTCAPFQVLAAEHWAFADTGVQPGDVFAERSLNTQTHCLQWIYNPSRPGMDTRGVLTGQGGSGWETDKITPTAPAGMTLLAKGGNPQDGGADMILIEPTGTRGGVFSASSITFGGSLLVDNIASRLVRNVLNRALG